mmetsp:Transcript_15476/g.36600  ORF Transcript_15476/g.36600 Transcript_15476/m.36600 type:complete len:288 (-) Transcript_15476:535-1398(-)
METISSPKEIMEAFRRSMSAFSPSTSTVLALRFFSLALSSEAHHVCFSVSASACSCNLWTTPWIVCLIISSAPVAAGSSRLVSAALWSRSASCCRNPSRRAFTCSSLRTERSRAKDVAWCFTCSRLRHFTSSRDSFLDTICTACSTACSSSVRSFWLDSKSAAFCRQVELTSSRYLVSASLEETVVASSSSLLAFSACFLLFSPALRWTPSLSAVSWLFRLASSSAWLCTLDISAFSRARFSSTNLVWRSLSMLVTLLDWNSYPATFGFSASARTCSALEALRLEAS